MATGTTSITTSQENFGSYDTNGITKSGNAIHFASITPEKSTNPAKIETIYPPTIPIRIGISF